MKWKSAKRTLSLGLALVMLAGTLAGCGNEPAEKESRSSGQVESSSEPEETKSSETNVQELEPVTLKMFIPGVEKEGTQDVFDAFNKRLAEVLPNTTVEFEFGGEVYEYANPWSMKLAGHEPMDIAWIGYKTNLYQDCVDGNILPINEYINENTPNLLKEMEELSGAYASITLDGKIYGIPNVQPIAEEAQTLWYSDTIAPYFDQEAMLKEVRSNAKLTEKMLDIIEEAFQGAIDDGVIKAGDAAWNFSNMFLLSGRVGYMQATPQLNYIYIDPEDPTGEPLHLWEIPEVAMIVKRMAKWVDKGWISEAAILDQLPSDSLTLFNIGNAYNNNWYGADENGIRKQVNYKQEGTTMMLNTVEEAYKPLSSFGSTLSYLGVPYTSQNPERAVMLLDILHGDPGTPGNDLINMLIYGFEENSEEAKEYGWCNYTAVEVDGQLVTDTTVRGDAEAKHGLINWVMTNTYKVMSDNSVMLSVGNKEYCLNFNANVYPNLKRCAISDMSMDISNITEELSAMTNVFNEYNSQINWGCGGEAKVDAVMEEALAKLKEAGWDTVKAELQRLIDEYNQ